MQAGSQHKAKLFIIEDDPDPRPFLCTFLSSMGCAYSVASTNEQVTAAAGRESFDAVLLDLRWSARPGERLASVLERIPPSLINRTLLITRERPDPATLNLADRYALPRLTANRLFFGVWEGIRKLLAIPRPNGPVPQGARVARMLFDSYLHPSPSGLRGLSDSTRKLTYQYDNSVVDVAIQPVPASSRISLIGQIIDGRFGVGPGADLAVVVNGPKGVVARARTNPMGEFAFEFEFEKGLELEFQADPRTWVTIQLPVLNEVRWRSSRRAIG